MSIGVMFVSSILWIWLGTFVVSLGFDVYNSLSVIKIAADNGYKINIDRLKNFNSLLDNDEVRKVNTLELFIPFHNLKKVKERQNWIESVLYEMINNLRITGVLEDMTELDIEEYQKKPGIKSALDIPIKSMKLQFEKNNNRMNDIEEKLRTIEKEVKETRVKDIEELKKIREEIIELSKSDSIPLQKISDIFLKDLEEIESIDFNENIEDGPKLEKKL